MNNVISIDKHRQKKWRIEYLKMVAELLGDWAVEWLERPMPGTDAFVPYRTLTESEVRQMVLEEGWKNDY